MRNANTGGPAFPTLTEHGFNYGAPGMTLQEYAAIKLKMPNSGTEWLDEMISQSLRNDFAAKAMQAYTSSERGQEAPPESVAFVAYQMADEMMQRRQA